ncbi:MAG: heme oxygenase (biliverdin-producing) [Brevibacterium yomogidense]|uniref:biliverdin-producing heme oxygenase n=1 Tax=Brevibacterium sp. Mu109 TaxID=1255669 RepID=UPI000C78AF54|nr:biliverdin-producing heme oxygenase [Brevibacterium sp. Mu109]
MTAVDAVPTDTAFSTRVKSQTQDAHDEAENSPFMGDLLGGKLDRDAYVSLLEQYLHLYRALEATEARFADSPELAGVLDPRLDRVAALEADLADLRTGTAPAAATPATRTYVDRLAALPQDAPERYFAHHYLRYLGDLSGGQVIGRLAARHYDLPAESLRTWRFEGIEKHKPYKDQYRAALDAAPLTEAQRDAFVDEARAGFILAKELFDSLA